MLIKTRLKQQLYFEVCHFPLLELARYDYWLSHCYVTLSSCPVDEPRVNPAASTFV